MPERCSAVLFVKGGDCVGQNWVNAMLLLHMSDNRLGFLLVELKLLGRTVVSRVLCGLKALFLNCLF